MTLRWKIAQLINGSVEIVQKEEKAIDHFQVHYNFLDYWKLVNNGPGGSIRLWMFRLDLHVCKDVRIIDD